MELGTEDVFNLPVGSFAEDSPTQPSSPCSDDEKKPLAAAHGFEFYQGGRSGVGESHEWATDEAVNVAFAPPRSSPFRGTPDKASRQPVFRSPPSALRRSPGLLHASPNLSFGLIDTPGTHLVDTFSPVGASMIGFPGYDAHAIISTHGDLGTPGRPMPRPREGRVEQSPFSRVASDVSSSFHDSGLYGVARSPVMTSIPRPGNWQGDHQDAYRSGDRPTPAKKTPDSDAKPRRLWQPAPSTGSGSKGLSVSLGSIKRTRQTLDGINRMMRGSHPQPGSHPHSLAYMHPKPSPMPHHASYTMPLQPSRPNTSGATTSVQGTSKPTASPLSERETPNKPKSDSTPSVASATKRGKSPSTAASSQPCNCKKSRCLKLYCTCFSAQRYCAGCKCVDCQNIPQFNELREAAFKEVRAKNHNAFETTVGCRCKKSECLKKYCECFQAGNMCIDSCRCVGCMNTPGSQKLIDKRRKMKDIDGANYAMRVADEEWKSKSTSSKKSNDSATKKYPHPPHHVGSPPPTRIPVSVPDSRAGARSADAPYHPYPAPYHMHAMGGYSPMSDHYRVPPGYHPDPRWYPHPQHMPPMGTPYGTESQTTSKRPFPKITPGVTPKSPKSSTQKKTRVEEPSFSFGTKMPALPRTVALHVFSFLSNSDRHPAVCKAWHQLTMEEVPPRRI